ERVLPITDPEEAKEEWGKSCAPATHELLVGRGVGVAHCPAALTASCWRFAGLYPRERPRAAAGAGAAAVRSRRAGRVRRARSAHRIRFAGQRPTSGVPKPSVCDRTGHHADESGDHVMAEWNARQPRHVARKVEGKERDRPHKRDQAPAWA